MSFPLFSTRDMYKFWKSILCVFTWGVILVAGWAATSQPTQQMVYDGWAPPLDPTSWPSDTEPLPSSSSGGVQTLAMSDTDGSTPTFSAYADNYETDVALLNLAENLGMDPLRIYEWVRNNIRTEHYAGGTRGAYLTFLERAGNDVDQCALLGALLKASGYTPVYRYNELRIPRTATGLNRVGVYEWLGVNDDTGALNVLHWYNPVIESGGVFRIDYMWISVDISGRGKVQFMPSIKPHTVGRRPNLDALTGYSWDNAITAANASTQGAYSPAINSAGLRSHLSALATSASNSIRSHGTLHDLGGAELARLPIVEPEVVTVTAPSASQYPEGLTLAAPGTSTWTGIPVALEGHFTLTVGNYTRRFEAPELLGKALVCEFGGDGTAFIRHDGQEIGQEASGGSSSSVTVTLAWEPGSSYFSGNPPLYRGSASVMRQNPIAIQYSFGSTGGRLRKTLEDVSAKEAASPSNVTLSDRLQITGQQYVSQCQDLASLSLAMLDHEVHRGCLAGVAFIKNGKPIVSFPVNNVRFKARSANAPVTILCSRVFDLVLGALEGTTITQTSGQRAFGMPSLIDYAMSLGRGAYLLDSANYSSTKGSLQNFNDATLGSGEVGNIEGFINAGHRVLVLADSKVNYGSGYAAGYLFLPSSGGVGSIIGGAFGGVGTGEIGSKPVTENTQSASAIESDSPGSHSQSTSADPVDLTNGAFLKNDVDLVLGDEAEPNGLRLERNYNSARRLADPVGLGRGWTHNYGLRVTMRSPNDFDKQRAGVDEVLPILIAARLTQDAVSRESSARAWLTASTAVSWAVDQMVNSRAAVAMGGRTLEFVRRPDGSYASPDNITAGLVRSADGSHTLSFRHGNTIHFRASDGKFTSIVDPFRNTLTATYDGSSRLYTVTDAYARKLTFSYDASGRLYQVADSTGRTVKYGRTAAGHFTFTDAENKMQTYEMDSEYLLTKVIDARNRTVVENDYDFWKRVWQQRILGEEVRTNTILISPGLGAEVEPGGHGTWVYFDARGRKIFSVDPLKRLTTWKYDGQDRLTKVITPRNSTTSYTYNSQHVLTSVTDPAGNACTIEPDSENRPWKVKNFEGLETVYTYHDAVREEVLYDPYDGQPYDVITTVTATARVAKITAPGGIEAAFQYDTRGRLWKHHPAAYEADAVLTYSYDANGYIDKVTYPGGQFDDHLYNVRGDLTELKDRRNAKTTFDYNARRQRTKIILWGADNAQYVTQTVYDNAGDIDYVLDASGRKVDLEHDALGQLLTQKQGPTSQQVATLTNVYNARGLIATSADALGNVVTYTYDGARQLSEVFDPLSHKTVFSYTRDGQLYSTLSPLQFEHTTSFDSRGLSEAVTDAADRTTDYTYDKDGRMKVLANRRNKEFTWTYDDANRTVTLNTATDKATTTTLNSRELVETIEEPSTQATDFISWDAEGRALTRTDGVGTTTYSYWSNGLLKEVSENGRTTYRGYDELNRLVEYQDGEGHTLRYDYYPSGELKEITYPDGVKKVTYAYDDFGRLRTVADWANRVTTYTYDDASRLRRIDRPNGTYRVQEFDAAGQITLIKEYKSDNSLIFYHRTGYDDDGRISSLFLHPKPAPYILPGDVMTVDDDNRLGTWNSQTVIHDADGNMTTGPLPGGSVVTYGYDARNRLTAVGGTGYRYNADGLRVEVTGSGAATYVIDPNAALSRVLVRTKGGATTYYVYGQGLLYEESGAATKTYHFNHLGSTLAITDGGGTVMDRVGYSPYGTITERTGSSDTPFLFHGELGVMTDGNGLVYMRARYYNPRLMRFCNADPIGFEGGMNWYAAFSNNPMILVDPLGLADSRVGWDAPNSGWSFPSLAGDISGSFGPGSIFGPRTTVSVDSGAPTVLPDGTVALPTVRVGVSRLTYADYLHAESYALYGNMLNLLGVPSLGDLADAYNAQSYGNSSDRNASLAMAGIAGALTLVPGGSSSRTLGRNLVAAESRGGLVIGKLDDLAKPSGWRTGDHTLHLPPRPPGPERWGQNARELQNAINQGKPIRDISPTKGGGFLERERQLLQQNGWKFDPQTGLWSPGG